MVFGRSVDKLFCRRGNRYVFSLRNSFSRQRAISRRDVLIINKLTRLDQMSTLYKFCRLIRKRNINKSVSFYLPSTTVLSSVRVGTHSCYGTHIVRISTNTTYTIIKSPALIPDQHLQTLRLIWLVIKQHANCLISCRNSASSITKSFIFFFFIYTKDLAPTISLQSF